MLVRVIGIGGGEMVEVRCHMVNRNIGESARKYSAAENMMPGPFIATICPLVLCRDVRELGTFDSRRELVGHPTRITEKQ